MIAAAVLLAATCAFGRPVGYFSGYDARTDWTNFASGNLFTRSPCLSTRGTLPGALASLAQPQERKRAPAARFLSG